MTNINVNLNDKNASLILSAYLHDVQRVHRTDKLTVAKMMNGANRAYAEAFNVYGANDVIGSKVVIDLYAGTTDGYTTQLIVRVEDEGPVVYAIERTYCRQNVFTVLEKD